MNSTYKVHRVSHHWERAGAYFVRIQAMSRKYHITLQAEFDEHDETDAHHILITENDFPIATCRFYAVDEASAMIGRVVVLPEYERKGLGRMAVLAAQQWMTELGFQKALVESRDVALTFYEKMGYKQTNGHLINHGTFDCYLMEKSL